ncbi:unnamed protein product [Amoebophrya sp. A120]|nr:unnamed protein product [Amoebophrya sp. A120]|eukprot:GSA120T00023600001.1
MLHTSSSSPAEQRDRPSLHDERPLPDRDSLARESPSPKSNARTSRTSVHGEEDHEQFQQKTRLCGASTASGPRGSRRHTRTSTSSTGLNCFKSAALRLRTPSQNHGGAHPPVARCSRETAQDVEDKNGRTLLPDQEAALIYRKDDVGKASSQENPVSPNIMSITDKILDEPEEPSSSSDLELIQVSLAKELEFLDRTKNGNRSSWPSVLRPAFGGKTTSAKAKNKKGLVTTAKTPTSPHQAAIGTAEKSGTEQENHSAAAVHLSRAGNTKQETTTTFHTVARKISQPLRALFATLPARRSKTSRDRAASDEEDVWPLSGDPQRAESGNLRAASKSQTSTCSSNEARVSNTSAPPLLSAGIGSAAGANGRARSLSCDEEKSSPSTPNKGGADPLQYGSPGGGRGVSNYKQVGRGGATSSTAFQQLSKTAAGNSSNSLDILKMRSVSAPGLFNKQDFAAGFWYYLDGTEEKIVGPNSSQHMRSLYDNKTLNNNTPVMSSCFGEDISNKRVYYALSEVYPETRHCFYLPAVKPVAVAASSSKNTRSGGGRLFSIEESENIIEEEEEEEEEDQDSQSAEEVDEDKISRDS